MAKRVMNHVFAVFGLAAVTAALLPAATVSAHDAKFDTDISIDCGENACAGDIQSKKGACVRQRSVSLYKRRDGKPDKFLGSDKSSDTGRWRVKHGRDGRFYAVVAADVKGGYAHTHRCRKATSGVARG